MIEKYNERLDHIKKRKEFEEKMLLDKQKEIAELFEKVPSTKEFFIVNLYVALIETYKRLNSLLDEENFVLKQIKDVLLK